MIRIKKPQVSIVMPSFNSERFLKEAIASVLSQTYSNWELLVIDDCSTDNSLSIAKQLEKKDHRIRLLSTKQNSGPALSRNLGIEASRGRYIAFLDSDDKWVPTKLATQISLMQEKNIAFCYAGYVPIKPDGSYGNAIEVPETISYQTLLRGSVIGCLTVIFDTSVFGRRYFSDGRNQIAGSWYSWFIDRVGHEDYVLWLSLLKELNNSKLSKYKAYGINQPLGYYRVYPGSFSGNKKKAALFQWITYRKFENISIIYSIILFSSYFLKGVAKHKKMFSNSKKN